MEILHIKETDSTNDTIKILHAEHPLDEGSVLVAHTQQKGRGQLNNLWEAEPGMNLTFSMLLLPHHIRPAEQFILSQAVALAVVDVLAKEAIGFSVKWPNDIYWNDKKIAGILIENDLRGDQIDTSVIGIGLNVNQSRFISNAPNPISLLQITRKEYDTENVLEQLIDALLARYEQTFFHPEMIRADYLKSLYRLNEQACYRDAVGDYEGVIIDVLPTGHLCVRRPDNTIRRYAFKEIEFMI